MISLILQWTEIFAAFSVLVWAGCRRCTQTQWGGGLVIGATTQRGHYWHYDLQPLRPCDYDLQRRWPQLCYQRYTPSQERFQRKKMTNTSLSQNYDTRLFSPYKEETAIYWWKYQDRISTKVQSKMTNSTAQLGGRLGSCKNWDFENFVNKLQEEK